MIQNTSTPITPSTETNTPFMETNAISPRNSHKQRQPHLLSTDSLTQITQSPSRPQSSSLEIPESSRSHVLLVEGPQSTTSRIDIWLDDQPDQLEDYDFERPQTSMRKTKRRAPDQTLPKRAWSTAAIPSELKTLVKDMEDIGSKVGVIPSAVKEKFAATEETIRDFQWAKDGEKHRGKVAEMKATDKMTGGLGHTMFWHRVSMIHQATIECLVESDPEPAWNSEVHSSILRLALEGHWKVKEVWYKDITVARISNNSLVPWNIATGAMQSKMVDYAIVINPSQKFTGDPSKSLHNHVIEKLRDKKAGASINQTSAEWVRFKPIAVNVETKNGAVGEDEAHMQLGTWLTAQYSRLRQLMPGKAKTKLPSVPVLSVQGQRWLLMIASPQDNERIDLIKELHLGDTGSVAGVYQVIAAIRRIAQWVNDEYRPWFEREILGIRAGGHKK